LGSGIQRVVWKLFRDFLNSNPDPETQNPNPHTPNPEPETQNPNSHTPHPEPETQNPNPHAPNHAGAARDVRNKCFAGEVPSEPLSEHI